MQTRIMNLRTFLLLALAACLAGSPAVRSDEAHMPESYVQLDHPEWTRDAVLYQINTRQFTPEGTFAAAEKHLPRLKALGVDILWLMPVQPIGKKHRKGELGSPYSIRDYYGVNPEFGDLESLKRFIAAAHDLGLYVILDWVANHTAWDNPLVEQHPEWFSRNALGEFHPPLWTDWSDVIQLDYGQPGLRRYMADAMKWWVSEVGMDGFRCDVAGFVPLDFWNRVRAELDAVRPVFMLAEWEERDLHARAFDMTYAWSWYNTVHGLAMGKSGVGSLNAFHYQDENSWPEGAMRLLFTSNHDKNAWEATQFEAFGEALDSAIVLSVVSKGTPMVYNGQEAGNARRLAFFDRDPIEWREHPIGELYRRLFALKKANSALWNGHWGADMTQVFNSEDASVFSFLRANDQHRVFAAFNFSPEAVSVRFEGSLHHGSYRDFDSGDEQRVAADTTLDIPAWGYRVLHR
ncbi:MAG: alpha-amylase [Xanthomonadales bacterium]|nr:alpha-amylase [Xanthomonadales bacterium]